MKQQQHDINFEEDPEKKSESSSKLISCCCCFIFNKVVVIIIIILLPQLLSILKLWFNFIFGLNFIFFCFKLIIHYHTQKPTYLGSMGNCLSRKAEMPTSVVDSGDSPFFTFPLPHCQQPHYPHHPFSALPPNWVSHLRELCEVLHEVKCYENPPLLDLNTYT